MKLVPRDYQQACLEACRNSVVQQRRKGLKTQSVCIVSPTGSGKSLMGAMFAHGAVTKGKRVLWNANRRELIGQAYETITTVSPFDVGVICPGTKRGNVEASIQVASFDTLRARNLTPPADIIIWDECHHVAAKTWETFAAKYPDAIHLGLTATPERADGKPLKTFNDLVVAATIGDLTARGYLVPCEVVGPPSTIKSGSVAWDEVDAWKSYAGGQQTVVFCSNVNHAKNLSARFMEAGISSGYVHGAMGINERAKVVDAFKRGSITVLCNVFCLTEGFDHRATAVCMIARTCGSEGMYLQMVGRALRPEQGKDKAVLIDLHGVVHKFGLPDEDREFSLDNGIQRKKDASSVTLKTCPNSWCCAVLPPSTPKCPRCGHVFASEAPPLPSNAEVGISMAVEIVDSPDRRRKYNDLLVSAASRGYKPGWAAHMFKSQYGHWPLRSWAEPSLVRV